MHTEGTGPFPKQCGGCTSVCIRNATFTTVCLCLCVCGRRGGERRTEWCLGEGGGGGGWWCLGEAEGGYMHLYVPVARTD